MDTPGTVNSNFGAIEDEERRLNVAERQIEDPDGPQADLTYQGLTFLQRIYDNVNDQSVGKMNAVGTVQFRFHRRALKSKYTKSWKKVYVTMPVPYQAGLLTIQQNHSELYSSPQEIYENCFLLGMEYLLNAYKPESRPLGWHLSDTDVAMIDSQTDSCKFLELITRFENICISTMEKVENLNDSSNYAEAKQIAVDSLFLLGEQLATQDHLRFKMYDKVLRERISKQDIEAYGNRKRGREFRDKNSKNDCLKVVENITFMAEMAQ